MSATSFQNPFPAILGLSMTEARLLMCIIARAPEPIAQADIWGTLYGDRPFIPASRVINRQISYMRKKLSPYKIELRSAHGRGYFVNEEDGKALHGWLAKRRRPLPGPCDRIPVALVITYFGERNRSPRAIEKMLAGEMTLKAVSRALSRAREAGRDIPMWYGGRANRPATMCAGAK